MRLRRERVDRAGESGMTSPRVSDPHRFDDLFTEFGTIELRRFFGGEGICAGEIMIGMIFDERIYFKTDETTRNAFQAEKCKPFSFRKRSTGETVVTGWFALPERLYDEPEELAKWARAALAVAAASPATRRKREKVLRKR
jgi:DNA transformation protein